MVRIGVETLPSLLKGSDFVNGLGGVPLDVSGRLLGAVGLAIWSHPLAESLLLVHLFLVLGDDDGAVGIVSLVLHVGIVPLVLVLVLGSVPQRKVDEWDWRGIQSVGEPVAVVVLSVVLHASGHDVPGGNVGEPSSGCSGSLRKVWPRRGSDWEKEMS